MVAGYRKGADVQQKELLRRLERKNPKGATGGCLLAGSSWCPLPAAYLPPCVVGDKSSKHPTCGAPRCRASRLLRRLPYDGDVAPGDTASRRAGENAESPETAPTLRRRRLGIVDEEVRAISCARRDSLESSTLPISLERSEEMGPGGWETQEGP